MSLTLITAPASEPVTTAEAKAWCKVSGTDEDTIFAANIKAARGACEVALGQVILPQTWEVKLDAFPPAAEAIRLAACPPRSITSISYVSTDGSTVLMDSADYVLDPQTFPGWVAPAVDTEWPDTLDVPNAVSVVYVAGLAADADSVPEGIKTWIKAYVETLRAQRGIAAAGYTFSIDEAMRFYDSLLGPDRRMHV